MREADELFRTSMLVRRLARVPSICCTQLKVFLRHLTHHTSGLAVEEILWRKENLAEIRFSILSDWEKMTLEGWMFKHIRGYVLVLVPLTGFVFKDFSEGSSK